MSNRIVVATLAIVVLLTACTHVEESTPCGDGGSSASSSVVATSGASSSSSLTASSSSTGEPYVQPFPDCGPQSWLNSPMTLDDGTHVGPGGVLPKGGVIRVPLLLSRGDHISTLRTEVQPDTHDGIYGTTLLSTRVGKVGRMGEVEYVTERKPDPYQIWTELDGKDEDLASATYALSHDIVMNLDLVVDDQFYFLEIAGESGPFARGARVCGVALPQ